MAEIKALSIRHEAIMDYLMMHPQVRLQDVAANFGVTGPWLSQIIHSDIFQTKLKEKTDIAFHHTVLSVKEKMTNLAHQALDKVAQDLAIADVRTAAAVADSMLDRLGFGAKPINGNVTINQQNNLVVPNASADEIAAARAMITAKKVPALGVTLNGHGVPIALPREGSSSVGETLSIPHLSATEGEYTEGESRAEIREEGP